MINFPLVLADMDFGIQFNKRNEPRDAPVLYKVTNPQTDAIAMCTWYKLSLYPSGYGRSLFQYVIDQTIEGFQVFLHSQPEKLEIHVGAETSIDVLFPTRNYEWTHLCVQFNKG